MSGDDITQRLRALAAAIDWMRMAQGGVAYAREAHNADAEAGREWLRDVEAGAAKAEANLRERLAALPIDDPQIAALLGSAATTEGAR